MVRGRWGWKWGGEVEGGESRNMEYSTGFLSERVRGAINHELHYSIMRPPLLFMLLLAPLGISLWKTED